MVIIIAFGFCLYSVTAEAAHNPGTPTAPLPPVSVSEDLSTWKRDPFIGSLNKGAVPTTAKGIPLKTGAVLPNQEQDIQLQGIMKADKRYHVLINGRSVKAGDTFGGVTVKEISRYRVVLLNERKEKIIYDIYQGRIDRGKQ